MLEVTQLTGFNAGNAGTPQTLLMLHGDGSDASTTITDSSSFARTCTVGGNAQLDTAFKQYGTASMLFDAAGDYITISASANAFNMGGGDFTIEGWVRRNGDAAADGIVGGLVSFGSSSFKIVFTAAGTTLNVENCGTVPSFSTTIPNTTWTHWAFTRENGKCNFWQAGANVASWNYFGSITNPGNLSIGSAEVPGGVNSLTGWLDDVRIVKGAAMYSAPFTPPTAALPNSP